MLDTVTELITDREFETITLGEPLIALADKIFNCRREVFNCIPVKKRPSLICVDGNSVTPLLHLELFLDTLELHPSHLVLIVYQISQLELKLIKTLF